MTENVDPQADVASSLMAAPDPEVLRLEKQARQRKTYAKELGNPRRSLDRIPEPQDRLNRRLALWRSGAHAGSLIPVSEPELALANSKHLIDIATIYAETGLIPQALDFISRAESSDPAVLDSRRYLGLIAYAAQYRRDLAERFAFDVKVGEVIRAGRGKFNDLVGNPSTTLCLVGNSPCEQGK